MRVVVPSAVSPLLPLVVLQTLTVPSSSLARGDTACEAPAPPAAATIEARTCAELLPLREAVWRAWFAGDSAAFRRVVPDELVSIDVAEAAWRDREAQVAASLAFAARGGTLRALRFPRNVVQRYGDVAILYSTYALELSVDGAVRERRGRVTEVFVRRGGRWVHTGWHVDAGTG